MINEERPRLFRRPIFWIFIVTIAAILFGQIFAEMVS